MSPLAVFIALSFLSLAIVAHALRNNSYRRIKKYKYQLHPNCLLTRHPIIFIAGKQSIFYHGRYFNFIPEYLEEHGYEVLYFHMPWRDTKKRAKELYNLAKVLTDEKTPSHFICDESAQQEIMNLKIHYPHAFASLNIMSSESKRPAPFQDMNLFLHNISWGQKFPIHLDIVGGAHDNLNKTGIEKTYLQLATELAENDYREGTPNVDESRPTENSV